MDKKNLRTLKVHRKNLGNSSQIRSISVQTCIIYFQISSEEFSQLLSIPNLQKALLLARLVGWVHPLSVFALLLACSRALVGVQCDLRWIWQEQSLLLLHLNNRIWANKALEVHALGMGFGILNSGLHVPLICKDKMKGWNCQIPVAGKMLPLADVRTA